MTFQQVHVVLPADARRRAGWLSRSQEELLHETIIGKERIRVKAELDTVATFDVIEFLNLLL